MAAPFKSSTYEVVSGGASDPTIISGVSDPSSLGVSAPEGSLYLRYVSGLGEVYFKAAGADTNWTQVGAGGGGGSLQTAYDTGNTITANTGPVSVNATLNAALEVNVSSGQIALDVSVGSGASTGADYSLTGAAGTSVAIRVNETVAQTVAAVQINRTIGGSTGANLALSRSPSASTVGNALEISMSANADGRGVLFSSASSPKADISLSLRASDPPVPAEGDLWYNTTNKVLRYYDGTATVPVGKTLLANTATDITAERIPYGDSAGGLATSGSLRWDVANSRVRLGTGIGAPTYSPQLFVNTTGADADVTLLRDSGVQLEMYAGAASGGVGAVTDHTFIVFANDQTVMQFNASASSAIARMNDNDDKLQTAIFEITGVGGAFTGQYMSIGSGSTAAVSAAGTGRIRYNESTNKLQFSNNGGAYADLGSGGGGGLTIGDPVTSGTANRILYENASNLLAESPNLSFNGSVLGLKGTLAHSGATSGSVSHAVPASITSYTVTWPSAQASGTQVLQNDGAGNLSWATVAGGGSLDDAYNGGSTITVDAGAVALSATAADNNDVLSVTKNPAGAQSGNGLSISMGANTSGAGISVTASGSGLAGDFTGDVDISGKLTVGGVIDPTGLVLSKQASVPQAPTASEGVYWARNDGRAVFTDSASVDHDIAYSVEQGFVGTYERDSSFNVPEGASTQEATLGRIVRTGHLIGVSAQLEQPVTAGTVVVNVKIGGVTKLTATLNTTDTTSKVVTESVGIIPASADQEVSVEVVGTGYTNAGGVTSGLSVVVQLSDGKGVGLGLYERQVTAAVAEGTATTEQTTGITAFSGSTVGLAVKLEEAVTAGTVTVNFRVGGVTALTAVLDTTNPTTNSATALIGTNLVDAGDDITLQIVTSGYTNAGGVTSGFTANLTLVNSDVFGDGSTLAKGANSNLWVQPGAPHPLDDEFDATSLAGSWAAQAGGVAGTTSPGTIDVYDTTFTAGTVLRIEPSQGQRKSWLLAQPPSSGTNFYLSKSVAPGTNFLMWSRLKFSQRTSAAVNNDSNVGIVLGRDAAGLVDEDNFFGVYINESDTGTVQAQFQKLDATTPTVAGTSVDVDHQGQALEYAAIHKRGAVYHGWVGTAAGNWIYLGSLSALAAGDPQRMGFTCSNASSAAPGVLVQGVDFIRVVETDQFLL